MNKKENILPPEEIAHLARDIGRPPRGDFRARVLKKIDELAKEERQKSRQKTQQEEKEI